MLTYGYDDLGRRTSLTPQGGTALSYVYDTLNRITTIQAGTANHVYAYTGVNPLVQSLTRPNGSVTSYQYDLLNRLTGIANKNSSAEILNQHVFTYNNQDMRGSETISGSALPPMPSLQEGTKDYDYDTANQLLSVTNPNQTFVYDDDGNMTQGYTPEGYVFTAEYDAEDRMTWLEYTDSSSVVHRTEYSYSGDDFLAIVRKFENSSLVDEIRIVRDGFLAVQERDGNNTVLREYTWGLNLGGGIGGLLNLKQGGQDYAYLYDGKGNVAAVLDASQAVVAAYRYAPFGKLLAQTGSLTQPFGFSTKRYDPQIGLIYYGHRFYAPAIGRWTTRDPLGEAGGINLYAFVGNNPVNWVDPFGLKIVNNSDYPVYYKPEVGPPYLDSVPPHETFEGEQDGIAIPHFRIYEVYKTVTGVDVIIHEDGSIEVVTEDFKSNIGQALIGGWKDPVWHLWLKDVWEDTSWDKLFEKSKGEEEPCE